jgi:uncharacterized protein YbjT (DUF2867 family)
MDIDSMSSSEISSKLSGCDLAILIPPASAKKIEISKKLVTACKEAQVNNVVLLSLQQPGQSAGDHIQKFLQIEEEAKKSGIKNFCIIRTGWTDQNMFLYAKQMKDTKHLGIPIAQGKFAPIDVRDVGQALCKILDLKNKKIHDKHVQQTYTLTGAQSMNGKEMAECAKQCGFKSQ